MLHIRGRDVNSQTRKMKEEMVDPQTKSYFNSNTALHRSKIAHPKINNPPTLPLQDFLLSFARDSTALIREKKKKPASLIMEDPRFLSYT